MEHIPSLTQFISYGLAPDLLFKNKYGTGFSWSRIPRSNGSGSPALFDILAFQSSAGLRIRFWPRTESGGLYLKTKGAFKSLKYFKVSDVPDPGL